MGRRLLLLTEDIEELKKELSGLQVGDRFTYGDYYGPIEWRVLDKDSDSLFVISEYGLDCKPFDKKGKTDDWNNCSLKKWLNSTFFNKVFNSEEKSLIEKTLYGKVFCLSIQEIKEYLSNNSDRKCRPTQYALSKGAATYQGGCWWWLRSQGYDDDCVMIVSYGGSVLLSGDYVYRASGCVRPVMKLKI